MARRVLWKAGNQVTLYERFTAAVAQADYNALVIFFGVSAALLAWRAIDWMPQVWQQYARLIAWGWAMLFLLGTVYYSL